jgi:hypothetical protein
MLNTIRLTTSQVIVLPFPQRGGEAAKFRRSVPMRSFGESLVLSLLLTLSVPLLLPSPVGAQTPPAPAQNQAPVPPRPPMFEVGAGFAGGAREHVPGADYFLVGTVLLSHTGQIHIHWDGVSLNLGTYNLGTDGTHFVGRANLPSITFDLQQLLGHRWMEKMNLVVSAGNWVSDAALSYSDLNLGRVSINLTQRIRSNASTQWTVSEMAGMTAYLRRERFFNLPGLEAVPVHLAVNTAVAHRFSPQVATSISVAVYANVLNGINATAGFEPFIIGGTLTGQVNIGTHWVTGATLDGSEMIRLDNSTIAPFHMVSLTAFLRYVFTTGSGGLRHAIQVNLGASYNELFFGPGPRATDPAQVLSGGLTYNVSF